MTARNQDTAKCQRSKNKMDGLSKQGYLQDNSKKRSELEGQAGVPGDDLEITEKRSRCLKICDSAFVRNMKERVEMTWSTNPRTHAEWRWNTEDWTTRYSGEHDANVPAMTNGLKDPPLCPYRWIPTAYRSIGRDRALTHRSHQCP